MSWRARDLLVGGITGLAGAIAIVAALRWLPTGIGWLAGLLAGGLAGAIASGLVSTRVIHGATACLKSLASSHHAHTSISYDDAVSLSTAVGSDAFEACVAELQEAILRLRRVEAEHSGVVRLAGELQEALGEGDGRGVEQVQTGGQDGGVADLLRHLLSGLRRASGSIDRELSGLEEANERVSSGASEQSDAVSRTATSVEALSDRIDRIAHHAGEAAYACEQARHEAHQGLEQVQSVIQGMDQLLSRIESNGRKVHRLEERSTEIGAIVEQIRGISSRTDMLALNATIESIRAGEHGRGFAVIAEEIRKLADRTAGATREVGSLVEAIQLDAQESLEALGAEQSQMQSESQRLRETGLSLERISQVAERSARLVDGISRSTRDQVQATQDLVRVMQRVSEVAQQTQERTAQARAFIGALKRSCGPWRRLAGVAESASHAGELSGRGLGAAEGSAQRLYREAGPGWNGASSSPPHTASSPRHVSARERVEIERAR